MTTTPLRPVAPPTAAPRGPRGLAAAALAALAVLALAGCGGGEEAPPPNPAREAAEQMRLRLHADDVERWRAVRLERLRAPDGWLSVSGLTWLDPGRRFAGASASNVLQLASGPPMLGLFDVREGGVWFTPERGVSLTLDGAPLARGTVRLRTDRDEGGASVIGFADGGRALVVERGGRLALRVYAPDAPGLRDFQGLEHFPTAIDWRLEARFEPAEAGATLSLGDLMGYTEALPLAGAVVFEREGAEHRLQAVDEGDGLLLLVFGDLTSGHSTYGQGRYLYAERPADPSAPMTLDFNLAYNPPCVFSNHASCLFAPAENRLPLRIEAGEKRYLGGAR